MSLTVRVVTSYFENRADEYLEVGIMLREKGMGTDGGREAGREGGEPGGGEEGGRARNVRW